MQRREFIKTAGMAAGLSALSYRRVLGANERIRLGIIGAGGRGRALWEEFLKQPDVAPAAVCDVYEPFRAEAIGMAKTSVPGFGDFRKLLEAPGIDAVIIATPDHWHALPTIAACEAGKDVYVEKPLSLRVREGRLMLDAARKHKRVVQTGSQQRSGAHYQRAADIVQSGALGEVCHVGAGLIHNAMPGFGGEDSKLPAGLDWEMWLGPAPYRESLPLSPIYHFRNFWDYSGGQMTNFGAHDLDIVRLVMNAQAPEAVAGFGRRFVLNDGGETPDVQEVIYQFPNFVVNWSVREMNGGKSGMFLDFHGTKGTLSLSRSGFEITPEVWVKSADPKQPQCQALKDPGSEQGTAHIRNFLDCVKSRERPAADIEQGHLTAVMCHLGNIATRTGKMLRWDPQSEQIIGDPAANEWLQYEYRKPWRLG
jgi:predicted dehydrogenase